jgi:hypothetical protein
VEIEWFGETHTSIATLRALDRSDCDAAGLLQFARTPWSAVIADRRWVGDLRFDREREPGFTEIEARGRTSCRATAPWLPPRNDVLSDQDR